MAATEFIFDASIGAFCAEAAEQRAPRQPSSGRTALNWLRTHSTALQAQLAGQTAALQRLQTLEAAEAEQKARGLLARLREVIWTHDAYPYGFAVAALAAKRQASRTG